MVAAPLSPFFFLFALLPVADQMDDDPDRPAEPFLPTDHAHEDDEDRAEVCVCVCVRERWRGGGGVL